MTTAIVRFYEGNTVVGIDYLGRFTLVVPALSPGDLSAEGNGFVNELDLLVPDPDDSNYIWWIGVWTNTDNSISEATVAAGFTFDSDSPILWDDCAVRRFTLADWNSFDGYSFPTPPGVFWDGDWNGPFDLEVSLDVHPSSDPDWNQLAPLPVHADPTWITPTEGTVFDARLVSSFNYSFQDSVQFNRWQVQLISGEYIVYDTGQVSTFLWGSSGGVIPLSYPQIADKLQVRVRTNGVTEWSSWVSLAIDVQSPTDTPLLCVDDELLLDSPHVLWMFRDDDLFTVSDLSGTGNDGKWFYRNEGLGGQTAAGFPTAFPTTEAIKSSGLASDLGVTYADYGRREQTRDWTGETWEGGINIGDIATVFIGTHAGCTISVDQPDWVVCLDQDVGDGHYYFAYKIITSASEPNTNWTVSNFPAGKSGVVANNQWWDGSTTSGIDFIEVATTVAVDGISPSFTSTYDNTIIGIWMAADYGANSSLIPDVHQITPGIGGLANNNWAFAGGNFKAVASEGLAKHFVAGFRDEGSWTPQPASGGTLSSGGRVCVFMGMKPLVPHTETVATIAKPSVTVGDTLYLGVCSSWIKELTSYHYDDIDIAPDWTDPAGLTLIGSDTKDFATWKLYKRVIDGSEPSSWSITTPGRTFINHLYVLFKTSDPNNSEVLEPTFTVGDTITGIDSGVFTSNPDAGYRIDTVFWQPFSSISTVGSWDLSPYSTSTSSNFRYDAWHSFPGDDTSRTLSGGAAKRAALITFARQSSGFALPSPLKMQEPAPICDPECGDLNYFVKSSSVLYKKHWFNGILNGDGGFNGTLSSPLISNTWSIEMVGKRSRISYGGGGISLHNEEGEDRLWLSPPGVDTVLEGDDLWHYVAVTYDASIPKFSVYVDGKLLYSYNINLNITGVNAIALITNTYAENVDQAQDASALWLAVYPSVLPINRIRAHYSHLCRTQTKNWSAGVINMSKA